MPAQLKADEYTYFIGTDISKNKLDHAVYKGRTLLFHQVIRNDVTEISAFMEKVKKIRNFAMYRAVFVMENTGFYGNHYTEVLSGMKANIVVEDAGHIKNSLGLIRGKNDKIDAMRIAEFAYKCREDLRLWIPKRQIILELANLATLRSRLMNLRGAIAEPLKEQQQFIRAGIAGTANQLCQRSIGSIKADIADVDKAISRLVAEDQRLSRIFAQIVSVPCIGPVTALQILITTNEFRDIRCPKKFACYAGVAPFEKQSGTKTSRARVSHIANKKMKSLLHICALSALRVKWEIADYYIRKTRDEGKHRMLVLNAIRNKLIMRVFACVLQDRFYEENYVMGGVPEFFEIPSRVIRTE